MNKLSERNIPKNAEQKNKINKMAVGESRKPKYQPSKPRKLLIYQGR